MSDTKISQREARRLAKRVHELEREIETQRNAWAREWPGGVHIGSVTLHETATLHESIRTARKLRHAVVVTNDDQGRTLMFHALPLPGFRR